MKTSMCVLHVADREGGRKTSTCVLKLTVWGGLCWSLLRRWRDENPVLLVLLVLLRLFERRGLEIELGEICRIQDMATMLLGVAERCKRRWGVQATFVFVCVRSRL
jgi:hypothetical protein